MERHQAAAHYHQALTLADDLGLAGGLNMPLVLASVLAPGPTPTLEQRRQDVDRHLQEIVTQLAGAGVEATAVAVLRMIALQRV